jgi:hypothetical protein
MDGQLFMRGVTLDNFLRATQYSAMKQTFLAAHLINLVCPIFYLNYFLILNINLVFSNIKRRFAEPVVRNSSSTELIKFQERRPSPLCFLNKVSEIYICSLHFGWFLSFF